MRRNEQFTDHRGECLEPAGMPRFSIRESSRALPWRHGDYFLTIRSTAWFTSSRAFLLAASRRVSFSLFSDRSDWRCDLSSLVRFFAILTVSHRPAPIATPCGFQTALLPHLASLQVQLQHRWLDDTGHPLKFRERPTYDAVPRA